MNDIPDPPRRPVRGSASIPLVLALGVSVLVSGCFGALEDEEAAFYARAARVSVGASRDDLLVLLGPATRVIRAVPGCREQGGSATWIYEYTPIEDDRLWLEEGPCVYCLSDDGRVLASEVRAALAPDHAGLIVVR